MKHSYRKNKNDQVERFFVVSAGEPEKGSLPRVRGNSDDVNRRTEMCFPPGFWSLPEVDDEVVVVDPFKDGMNRTIIGVIPNFMIGLNPGDRIIYTEGGHIIIEKTGKITVVSDEDIEIKNSGGATIKLGKDGIIDLN